MRNGFRVCMTAEAFEEAREQLSRYGTPVFTDCNGCGRRVVYRAETPAPPDVPPYCFECALLLLQLPKDLTSH